MVASDVWAVGLRLVAAAILAGLALMLMACAGGESAEDDPAISDPAAALADAATAGTDASADGDSGDEAGDEPAAQIVDDGSNSSLEGEPIDPLAIPGRIMAKENLVMGDCFNRLEGMQGGRRYEVTARVGCDESHWAEVFHTFDLDVDHPAVFPGDDVMRTYTRRLCYDRFESFVGEVYELSVYEIEVFTPSRLNFEHEQARYRGVHCWLHRTDGQSSVGTAQGTAQ